jgi:hypothetical protein
VAEFADVAIELVAGLICAAEVNTRRCLLEDFGWVHQLIAARAAMEPVRRRATGPRSGSLRGGEPARHRERSQPPFSCCRGSSGRRRGSWLLRHGRQDTAASARAGSPMGSVSGPGLLPPGRSLRTHHRGSPAAGGAAFWRVWTPQGMRVTLDTTVTFSAGLILGLYRGGLWG